MSSAVKIEQEPEQTHREEREFTFHCRRVGCACQVSVFSKGMAGARARVMEMGWRFRKMRTVDGGGVEVWSCPPCAAAIDEAIKKHRTKGLLRYTTEAPKETEDERQMKAAETRHTGSQTSFERGYGRILNSAEMTACARLRDAMTIVEIAGNACMSYEPVSVDSFNYGSKTISDRVMNAQGFVRQCHKTVVGDVQRYHHDAWKVLISAIVGDWTVQQTGDEVCKMRKDRKNEKERRELAAVIVQKSAAAIAKTI